MQFSLKKHHQVFSAFSSLFRWLVSCGWSLELFILCRRAYCYLFIFMADTPSWQSNWSIKTELSAGITKRQLAAFSPKTLRSSCTSKTLPNPSQGEDRWKMAEGKGQLLAIEGCGLWQAQAGRSQPRLRVAVAVAVTVNWKCNCICI